MSQPHDQQRIRHRIRPAMWISLLGIALGGLAFWWIAHQVAEGDLETLDHRILLAMRESGDVDDPVGPIWFEEAVRDVTALGGIPVLTFLTVFVSAGLALAGHRRAACAILATVLIALATNHLLKTQFDRPRPDLVPHRMRVLTRSFPSGHAMISSATYLAVALVVASQTRRLGLQILVIAGAVSVVLAIGLSRVYLGVHWPSDVMAGWLAGAVVAITVWKIAAWWEAAS